MGQVKWGEPALIRCASAGLGRLRNWPPDFLPEASDEAEAIVLAGLNKRRGGGVVTSTAIDPSLLIYEPASGGKSFENWDTRIEALVFHKRMIRAFSHRVVMTDELVAKLWRVFPWAPEYKSIAEFRDLRQFLSDLAQRQQSIWSVGSDSLVIEPAGVTCEGLEDEEVRTLWLDLLGSCWLGDVDIQVATYIGSSTQKAPEAISVAFAGEPSLGECTIPLVWNEESWFRQVSSLDHWPDLGNCVAVCFRRHTSLHEYAGYRKDPMPFKCTAKFDKSIERITDPKLRLAVVEAVMKKVHGVLDSGLSDEKFGNARRLRVSLFWRINYDVADGTLVFDEFGEHDIGM